MDSSYCNKCKKTKKIDEFYKSSYSRCKDCRKKDNRKNNFKKKEVLYLQENIYNKINSIEILYNDLLARINDINNNIYMILNKIDNKEPNIENNLMETLNNISIHDKNIQEQYNKIINFNNKNNLKSNFDKYNEEIKQLDLDYI